jgi:excisionase family DNA binding protein
MWYKANMNREEAASTLGISVRSLQRTVKAGKLSVTYKRGTSGKQEAFFDPDEIARYKEEMETETVKPALPEVTTQDMALARVDAQQQFFGALQQLMTERQTAKDAHPIVPIESKPLLKLDEASMLTGLSRRILRAAIDEGKLKAGKLGRAWRVRRTDLDAYIQKLSL